jgi:hypothetical protein
VARLVIRGIGRVEIRQTGGERCSHARDVARVELDVRIAGRMHVAVGTVEPQRLLEHADEGRRFQIAGLARLHAGIASLPQDQRQPAHFQLGAGGNHQVGVARPCDQAGFRLDVMRILQGVRRSVDLDLIAAEFLGEGCPFRNAGKNVERRQRRQGEKRQPKAQEGPDIPFHGLSSLSNCAHRARPASECTGRTGCCR